MGPIDGHYDFFLTWEGDRGDRLVNFPRSFACLFVLLASAALSSGTTESFCLIGNHGRYGRAYRCVRKGATFVVEPIPGIMFGGWAEEVYYDTTNETLYVADGSARLFRVDLRMPRGQARMNTTMTNWDYFFMSRPTKPSTQQEF